MPSAEAGSPTEPFTFERVATAIWMYRLALLNFEGSRPEKKEVNGRALDGWVQTLYEIFDNYGQLCELTRQLVGVFLKELYFECQ